MSDRPRPSVVAGLFAFAAYSIVAWPTAGWFDGGELVASAWGLGVSHPPGHPIWATTAALFVRLPLGSIAFRVALASAAGAAVTVALVVEIVLAATERLAPPDGARRWALVAAGLFGTSALVVDQAVRPEVYALAGALVAAMILCAVRFTTTRDARALGAAGLVAGLGGANHHLLALLAVPSVAVAAWGERADPARARRGTSLGIGFACVALALYAYLPLRAGALVSVSSPRTLGEIAEVVSARVYQKAALGDAPGGIGHRAVDVGAMLVLGTGGLFALLSLGGLWTIARVRKTRDLVGILAIPVFLYPVVRTWLGFTSGNPDAEGYLVPAIVAMASAIGVLFVVGHSLARKPGGPGPGAIAVFVVLTIATFGLAASETLARPLTPEEGPEVYSDAIFDEASPRAVVLLTSFEVDFALAGRVAAEGPRPDLNILGLPFLSYPGRAREIAGRGPALRPLLRGWLLDGEVPETEIAALAAERPVLLEVDPHVGVNVRPYVTPVGPLALVHGEPRSAADLVATAEDHFARWDRIYSRLGEDAQRGETSNVFAWRHFEDALLFAARGERGAAEKSARLLAKHLPHAPELARLERALARGAGPIDVEPLQPR